MKGLRNCITALAMGLFAPVLVWVGAGAALYQRSKETRLLKQALPGMVCALDNDCPPGYTCMGGRCVPQT